MRGLLLSVGDDAWAVPLEQAHEVIASPALTSIPGSPRSLLGVCNRRGEVLPVVSLRSVLGIGSPTDAELAASWVTVVSTRTGPAGIVVTVLPEVVELGHLAPPGGALHAVSVHLVDGASGPHAITLLDLDAVLTPTRVATQP